MKRVWWPLLRLRTAFPARSGPLKSTATAAVKKKHSIPLSDAPRGRPADGPLNHKTSKGWVKGKRGDYHGDALFVKRNRVEVILHEDIGGGFSPPAHKIRRLGRKSREHGVDRTSYKGDCKI